MDLPLTTAPQITNQTIFLQALGASHLTLARARLLTFTDRCIHQRQQSRSPQPAARCDVAEGHNSHDHTQPRSVLRQLHVLREFTWNILVHNLSTCWLPQRLCVCVWCVQLAYKSGVIEATITNADIPSAIPIKLNTVSSAASSPAPQRLWL